MAEAPPVAACRFEYAAADQVVDDLIDVLMHTRLDRSQQPAVDGPSDDGGGLDDKKGFVAGSKPRE